MNSYVLSALVGMVGMSFGMVFLNKASLMVSPRVVMFLNVGVTIIIVYIWTKIIGDKFIVAFRGGWTPMGYALLSGFFIAIGLLGLVEAFGKGGPGNVVVPIWGAYIVVSSILATIFLGAPINIVKGVGIGAVFVGIVLVSM